MLAKLLSLPLHWLWLVAIFQFWVCHFKASHLYNQNALTDRRKLVVEKKKRRNFSASLRSIPSVKNYTSSLQDPSH